MSRCYSKDELGDDLLGHRTYLGAVFGRAQRATVWVTCSTQPARRTITGHRNKNELNPHTDFTELVGFDVSAFGQGRRRIAPCQRARNHMRCSDVPEHLKILYRGFVIIGAVSSNPVPPPLTAAYHPASRSFRSGNGRELAVRAPAYIEAPHRNWREPLTAKEVEALDLFQDLAKASD